MSDTASRTFELLGLLQRRGFVTATRLADELEVTTRTVRRDIARLRDLGYPIDTRLGLDGGYSLEPDAALPPIFFGVDEAVATSLALGRWREASDDQLVTSALHKIQAALPQHARWVAKAVADVTRDVPADALPGADAIPVDLGTLGQLATSCAIQRRIGFDYVGADRPVSARLADPHALVHTARRWYLAAFDVEVPGWRLFRVDRISGVSMSELPATRREVPGGSLDDWVVTQLAAGLRRVAATVRVHAPIESVSRRVAPAWATVEADGTEASVVRAGADSYDAMARWFLGLGAEVSVIEPDELRDAFRAVAEQAARAAKPVSATAGRTH